MAGIFMRLFITIIAFVAPFIASDIACCDCSVCGYTTPSRSPQQEVDKK
jgi:hypothetical protein